MVTYAEATSELGLLDALKPCRMEGIIISTYGAKQGEDQRYIIKDKSESFYIITGVLGVEIINRLDGNQTLTQLKNTLYQQFNASISIEKIKGFINLCFSNSLIIENTWEIGAKKAKKENRREKLGIYSKTYKADEFLDFILSYKAFWLNSLTKFLFMLVFFSGLVSLFFIPEGGGLLAPMKQMTFNYMDVFLLVLPFCFVIELALHELAHALSCRLMGAKTAGFGIGLLWGILPIFYTETTDVYTITNKYKRMFVSFAGPMVNIFFFGMATVTYYLLEPSLFSRLLLAYSGLSLSAFIVSLNPFLLRMDGYWILSDWEEEPNLKRNAVRYLKGQFYSLIGKSYKINDSLVRELSKNKYLKSKYITYALIAFVWTASYISVIFYEIYQFMINIMATDMAGQVYV